MNARIDHRGVWKRDDAPPAPDFLARQTNAPDWTKDQPDDPGDGGGVHMATDPWWLRPIPLAALAAVVAFVAAVVWAALP